MVQNKFKNPIFNSRALWSSDFNIKATQLRFCSAVEYNNTSNSAKGFLKSPNGFLAIRKINDVHMQVFAGVQIGATKWGK